jgi:hypothetical protein
MSTILVASRELPTDAESLHAALIAHGGIGGVAVEYTVAPARVVSRMKMLGVSLPDPVGLMRDHARREIRRHYLTLATQLDRLPGSGDLLCPKGGYLLYAQIRAVFGGLKQLKAILAAEGHPLALRPARRGRRAKVVPLPTPRPLYLTLADLPGYARLTDRAREWLRDLAACGSGTRLAEHLGQQWSTLQRELLALGLTPDHLLDACHIGRRRQALHQYAEVTAALGRPPKLADLSADPQYGELLITIAQHWFGWDRFIRHLDQQGLGAAPAGERKALGEGRAAPAALRTLLPSGIDPNLLATALGKMLPQLPVVRQSVIYNLIDVGRDLVVVQEAEVRMALSRQILPWVSRPLALGPTHDDQRAPSGLHRATPVIAALFRWQNWLQEHVNGMTGTLWRVEVSPGQVWGDALLLRLSALPAPITRLWPRQGEVPKILGPIWRDPAASLVGPEFPLRHSSEVEPPSLPVVSSPISSEDTVMSDPRLQPASLPLTGSLDAALATLTHALAAQTERARTARSRVRDLTAMLARHNLPLGYVLPDPIPTAQARLSPATVVPWEVQEHLGYLPLDGAQHVVVCRYRREFDVATNRVLREVLESVVTLDGSSDVTCVAAEPLLPRLVEGLGRAVAALGGITNTAMQPIPADVRTEVAPLAPVDGNQPGAQDLIDFPDAAASLGVASSTLHSYLYRHTEFPRWVRPGDHGGFMRQFTRAEVEQIRRTRTVRSAPRAIAPPPGETN